MKTINQLQNHRTYRQFDKNYQLSETELQAILDSARQAPTWMNGQLYSIIVIRDLTIRQKLVELTPNNPHIKDSSVFLVFLADLKRTQKVAEKHSTPYHVGESVDPLLVATADAAFALENAVVATEALGLASVVVGGIRNEIDQVAKLLNLPDYVFPLAGLTIGKPIVEMKIKPRLPEKAVVHYDTYQDYDYALIEDYDLTMKKFAEKRETKDWTKKFLDVYSTEPNGKIDAFLKKQKLLK
ncbi:NADPH-dependent oxidoreductase [Enterococcus asini]|uniref:NADPH-dependent oxidoreductase n=1 Tax=Enterococcus asini TaxID=57732 RepID=UPI00288D4194|nr:NADPH-dependent oxidoreductase [Enterococcus asini]MDT2757098.1 NADPH-dependent oxidoreductase [Enterococcus asini]